MVAKRLRRKLERKWRKSKPELDLTAYKTQCMHVNKGLEAARIKYYNNEVAEHQGNTKGIFSVARKLMGDSDDPVLPSLYIEMDLHILRRL